jgi:uncharacterized protein (TIGR03067 family)
MVSMRNLRNQLGAAIVSHFLCLSLLLAQAGAGAPKNLSQVEMDRFRGTWTVLSVEMRGQKGTPGAADRQIHWIFEGNQLTLKIDDSPDEPAIFRLDPSREPKHIEISVTGGKAKGNTLLGIYELVGDKLRICTATYDNPRPIRFDSANGTAIIFSFARQHP